jgi:hypothetical protein
VECRRLRAADVRAGELDDLRGLLLV